MTIDYTTITELPGACVTKLQLERSSHRYSFGAAFCEGKDVLEIACGGGQGLGMLARRAKSVVGGDLEEDNLIFARETYKDRDNIKIVKLDAHDLQFKDANFDVILLYEAIYYLHTPEKFLKECNRVLKKGGKLIICTANKDWPDFNPSPFSYKYFSVPELNKSCEDQGFSVEFYGAFPDHTDTFFAKFRSFVKRGAVRCNLMPKTMKGKVLFKRLFYGDMVVLPNELADTMADYEFPEPIAGDRIDTIHTAIYAVCHVKKN